MVRVVAYVDGFNLYHGLRAQTGRKYLWLDLHALAESLLKSDQSLLAVKYFTARVRDARDSEQRQSAYLDALVNACPTVSVTYGRFQRTVRRCANGHAQTVYEEKQTDVNIAVSLVDDAAMDVFDVALLVSADSDLCRAVETVKLRSPAKRVIAAFPPRRDSHHLQGVVDGFVRIGVDKFRQSQLPVTVVTPAGVVLSRPKHWSGGRE